MFIEEINTYDRRQARQFLEFPFILYKDCEQWVPMLEVDARKFLDCDRFFYYRESDAAFFIVFSEKYQPIG